jgi:hypothetical protein
MSSRAKYVSLVSDVFASGGSSLAPRRQQAAQKCSMASSPSFSRRLLSIALFTYLVLGALAVLLWLAFRRESLYNLGVFLVAVGGVAAFVGCLAIYEAGRWQRSYYLFRLSREMRTASRDPYPHYVMSAIASSCALALSGILLITASPEGDVQGDLPQVGSLRAELPRFNELVRAWHPDAYLAEAELSLLPSPLWRISAEYRSPNDKSYSLAIEVKDDGTVKTKSLLWRDGVRQLSPIVDADWPIDSDEAIQIFGRNPALHSCLASIQDDDLIADLRLERAAFTPDQTVVWDLVLPECEQTYEAGYLDASTGEMISRPK